MASAVMALMARATTQVEEGEALLSGWGDMVLKGMAGTATS